MAGNPDPGDATRDLYSHPEAAATPLHLGQGARINGRYVIEKELGRGGIGVVYLARDERLHQMPVVIKFLLDDSTQSAWLGKKFLQEAEALTRIKHPGVVSVIDRDRTGDGKAYFVMEFVRGRSLRSVITPDGIDLEYAATLVRQIGQALNAAHREGVFHRDLKPENIMLETLSDGDEQVKLIDFGIAKLRDSESGATTEQGMVAGSLNYMAPEQLLGGQITAATDIYALGIIAYELVAGRRPFNPDSRSQLLAMQQLMAMQQSEQFVTPCRLRPSLPESAEAILLKALSFDPNRRPVDARQFGEELSRALTDGATSPGYTPDLIATQLVDPKPSAVLDPAPTAPNVGRVTQREQAAALDVTSESSKKWLFSAGFSTKKRAFRFQIIVGSVAALAVVAVVGGSMLSRGPNREAAEAVRPAQPVSSVSIAKSELVYSITVKRDPKVSPGSKPFQLAGEAVFGRGDRVQLNVSCPRPGHLYVINESPPLAGGTVAYNILFPSPSSNDGTALLPAGKELKIPEQGEGFVFDDEEGTEKLWLIWSPQPIGALEALKRFANPRDRGEIKDAGESSALAEYLASNSSPPPEVERDDDKKLTTVRARTDLLVKLIRLEHH
jgi:serine/threonine-protein kinase